VGPAEGDPQLPEAWGPVRGKLRQSLPIRSAWSGMIRPTRGGKRG
jgi:hypothetical protein